MVLGVVYLLLFMSLCFSCRSAFHVALLFMSLCFSCRSASAMVVFASTHLRLLTRLQALKRMWFAVFRSLALLAASASRAVSNFTLFSALRSGRHIIYYAADYLPFFEFKSMDGNSDLANTQEGKTQVYESFAKIRV